MCAWREIGGNLTTPRGFRAAAVAAGIKKAAGALDLALIFSDARDTAAAGMFTTNVVAAAPVELSRRHLKETRGWARAVVVNSGNANACTGAEGLRTSNETARAAAKLLGISPLQVLVASTGVIGVPLKLDLILNQLPVLAQKLSADGSDEVARAIRTTDTLSKSCALRTEAGVRSVCLAGVAKGAGMIHPRMATMLAFITTDAVVAPTVLRDALRAAVNESFNRITVDGDTSTNDTVLALASGASGATVRGGAKSASWFADGLVELCQTLAKLIAKDGEGASKLVAVEVWGAKTAADADRVARAVANSPLVKTALAGSDPNWGRIICAAGYSGAKFNPAKVDILVNDFFLCRAGLDAGFDEDAARRELGQKQLTIRIDLHQGRASGRIWTCDLTHDYITINASYRT